MSIERTTRRKSDPWVVGEEEAVAEAVATVAAAKVEATEVRITPVLAPVAESKAYDPHSARTCSTTVRRRLPIR